MPGVTALQHDLNLFYIFCVKVLTKYLTKLILNLLLNFQKFQNM